MADYVGQQLGNYQVIRLLADGDLAQVYLGEHIFLGTQAAIKVLLKLSAQEKQDFYNEARIVAKLIHSHIIRILEFGEMQNGSPYIIMDYAVNGTLRDRYPHETQLPLSVIIPYIEQAAAALQFGHNAKVIHRDIKPENMLLNQKDHIFVSDFGIAVAAHSTLTQKTENVAGTFYYTAPEQFKGKPVVASDQYALAIVTYELLCGLPPFQGSFLDLYHKHQSEQPPSLCAKVPSVSLDIEKIIFKALNKDPKQRFANIRDFADALEQVSRSQQTHTLATQVKSPPRQPLSPITPTIIAPFHGTLLGNYQGHSDRIISVAWSPNGQYLASRGNDERVQVWNTRAGNNIFTFPFSPNRSSFLNKLLRPVEVSPVTAMAWSPKKEWIAVGSDDGTVEVWDVRTQRMICNYHASNGLYNIIWSPDGMRIGVQNVVLTRGDLKVKKIAQRRLDSNPNILEICDVARGEQIFTYLFSSRPIISWSPDGQRIALASFKADKAVQVLSAITGGKIFSYQHADGVRAIAWSPDGTRLATASKNIHDGIVQTWNTVTGESILSYSGHNEHDQKRIELIQNANWTSKNITVNTIAWSPDGAWLASGDHGTIKSKEGYYNNQVIYPPAVQIWNASTGKRMQIYLDHSSTKKGVHNAAWLPDSQHIISRGKEVKLWNISSGKTLFTYPGSNPIVLLSPDGTLLATASDEKTLQIWEATTGSHIFTYMEQPTKVNTIAWSPNSKRIATGADDGIVRIWQAL